MIDEEVGKYRKKSTAKGQPRSNHKHEYQTVLLTKYYEGKDFTTGKPKTTKHVYPTRYVLFVAELMKLTKTLPTT